MFDTFSSYFAVCQPNTSISSAESTWTILYVRTPLTNLRGLLRMRILVAAKNLNFLAPLFCCSGAEGSLAAGSQSLASDSVGDHRP